MSYNTFPPNPFPPNSENVGSGGVDPYVLPVASAEMLGGVKVGENLTIDENGVLSALGGGGGGGLTGWHSYELNNLTGGGSSTKVFTPKIVEPYVAFIVFLQGAVYNGKAFYMLYFNPSKPAKQVTKITGDDFSPSIADGTGAISAFLSDHGKTLVLSTTEMTVS